MKLRRNEFCPIHRSVSCCGREKFGKHVECGWVSSALKIPTTRGDTENSDHPQRCGNC